MSFYSSVSISILLDGFITVLCTIEAHDVIWMPCGGTELCEQRWFQCDRAMRGLIGIAVDCDKQLPYENNIIEPIWKYNMVLRLFVHWSKCTKKKKKKKKKKKHFFAGRLIFLCVNVILWCIIYIKKSGLVVSRKNFNSLLCPLYEEGEVF